MNKKSHQEKRTSLFENLVKVIEDNKVCHEDVAHVLCNILGNLIAQLTDDNEEYNDSLKRVTFLISKYASMTAEVLNKNQTTTEEKL